MSNMNTGETSTIDELEEHAKRVNEYLAQIDERNRKNLEDVVKIGIVLFKVNHELPLDEYKKWLAANTNMTLADSVHYIETAQSYKKWSEKQSPPSPSPEETK